MKKLLLLASLLIALTLPVSAVHALNVPNAPATNTPATNTPATPGTNTPASNTTSPSASCVYDKNSSNLCNPISDANDLNSLILKALKYMLGLIGTVAVVMIVIAGFRMVASQGNENQVKSAKATITWSIIGVVVAFLAYSIVAILQNVLISSK